MRFWTIATALGLTMIVIKASDARHNSIKNRYESNYSATWTAINNLTGQFTPAQITFLNSLSQMTTIGGVPMATDPTTGTTWASGERDYVNAPINVVNSLIDKLERNGYMSL
jgi:hypothetical protein